MMETSNLLKIGKKLPFNAISLLEKIRELAQTSPLVNPIPGSVINIGQPTSERSTNLESPMDYTEEFSEGECDLSDIGEFEESEICLELRIGTEAYHLYKNRLLSYGEAARIFYSLNKEHMHRTHFNKSVDKIWDDDEIYILNWLVIVYTLEHKLKPTFMVLLLLIY